MTSSNILKNAVSAKINLRKKCPSCGKICIVFKEGGRVHPNTLFDFIAKDKFTHKGIYSEHNCKEVNSGIPPTDKSVGILPPIL